MAAKMCSLSRQFEKRPCMLLKHCAELLKSKRRNFCDRKDGKPSFGLLFDIDGVIVRGKKVLPSVPESFRKLLDSQGKFRIPTVFVTNAGNSLRHQKAQQLSNWLDIEVSEEQVVMAHSPLRMFQQFHDKQVLISGQGPIVDIAKHLGFKKVTTIDQLRGTFPLLDAVDHKRRISVPCTFEEYFPQIEAIVLFGEPIRWETALQLIVDTLMTNGVLSCPSSNVQYPHIPLLACNMDLQWMAEALMPRFGHGAFLLCLENLYKKITGHNLIYTALVGKPSEITYHHAHHMIIDQARNIGIDSCLKRLYAIGDNVYTDIFGANLYDRYLCRHHITESKRLELVERSLAHLLGNKYLDLEQGTESCSSVLVQTGVYSKGERDCLLDHSPRDFLPVEEHLRAPKYTVENVSSAIDLIFKEEGFH